MSAGGSVVKLNRSGVTACAVYMVAIIWLIATRYSGTQASAVDAAEFFLVTWPLAFLGLNMFGSEEFWTKYQLFFFPACFVVFYLVGCGIGRIMGFERLSDASERGKPPDTP
jgi:hypothetical protein